MVILTEVSIIQFSSNSDIQYLLKLEGRVLNVAFKVEMNAEDVFNFASKCLVPVEC